MIYHSRISYWLRMEEKATRSLGLCLFLKPQHQPCSACFQVSGYSRKMEPHGFLYCAATLIFATRVFHGQSEMLPYMLGIQKVLHSYAWLFLLCFLLLWFPLGSRFLHSFKVMLKWKGQWNLINTPWKSTLFDFKNENSIKQYYAR